MQYIVRNVWRGVSFALALVFVASLSIAGPEDDYTLGPRDVVKVTVWGQEDLSKDYPVNPQVLVSVKDFLSKKVYVLGETEKRGVFYLSKPTTLLDILSEAGGLAKSASRQLVLVRSHGMNAGAKGKTILRLNVDKIQAGDMSENVRLEDDDMIIVSKAHAHFVLGEVR